MDAATTFPAASLELLTTALDERALIARAAAALHAADRREELLGAILARVGAEVPFYATVDPAAVRPGIAGDLDRGLRALGEQRPPTVAEVDRSEEVGAACARQGIPVEAMIHSFQVATHEALTALQAEATAQGAPPALQLRLVQAGWAWATFVMAAQARAHRRVELEHARRDDQQRADLLRRLLTGTATPAQRATAGAVLGLAADAEHVPFRIRSLVPGEEPHALRARVERRLAATGRAAAVAVLDDAVAGLAAGAAPAVEEAVTGTGPAAPLERIAAAFAEASTAADVCAAFGLPGVHDLEGLGLLTAVATDRATGERLRARHLAPLDALGGFGAELAETLRAWLEHRRSVTATASALHVHPNTLRHRLERYEQVTGADLGDVRTIAELWWALADPGAAVHPRRDGRGRPPGREDPGVDTTKPAEAP